jgi:hypothetical protein
VRPLVISRTRVSPQCPREALRFKLTTFFQLSSDSGLLQTRTTGEFLEKNTVFGICAAKKDAHTASRIKGGPTARESLPHPHLDCPHTDQLISGFCDYDVAILLPMTS